MAYDIINHADYPHNPGTLYDCQACEDGPCVCGGEAGCVSSSCPVQDAPEAECYACQVDVCPDHDPEGFAYDRMVDPPSGARMPAYFDGPISNGGFGE